MVRCEYKNLKMSTICVHLDGWYRLGDDLLKSGLSMTEEITMTRKRLRQLDDASANCLIMEY